MARRRSSTSNTSAANTGENRWKSSSGQLRKACPRFHTMRHQFPDDLVRMPERHPAPHQVIRQIRRQQHRVAHGLRRARRIHRDLRKHGRVDLERRL